MTDSTSSTTNTSTSAAGSKANKLTSHQDRALTANALEEFNKNNYGSCLQNLSKLDQSNGVDVKVVHNKAVAEFYKSDLKKYQQFQKILDEIIGKIPIGNTFEITDTALLIAYYNKALIFFHLRQPQAALKIMIAVMQHMDKMDDSVVQRAGLLTLNLLLNTNQIKKADGLVLALQNRLNISSESFTSDEDEDNQTAQQQQQFHQPKEKSQKSLDYFKWMFRIYKMRSNILSGKPILIPNEETAEISILRGHQYYCGIDYQMAAKELSKNFTLTATVKKNGESHNTIIANNMGIIHFHVRHYAMAVRFFQHALTFDQQSMENGGTGGSGGGGGGGGNASNSTSNNNSAQEMPLHCVGATKRPEILYNLGVGMLHLQRPKEAFECLLVPLSYYHNNPRIWLRLAEACIMVHNHNLKEKENKNLISSVYGSGIHRKYIIQPTPMKYVSDESQSFAIPNTNLEFASLCLRNALTLVEFYTNELQQSSSSPPSTTPLTTPILAATTVTMATAASISPSASSSTTNTSGAAGTAGLSTGVGTAGSSTTTESNWSEYTEKAQCNPSKPLSEKAFKNLKCAVLAAASYVQICLGDYLLALTYAKQLIQLNYLPDAYAMLGHLYCAESLIMLDRLTEARQYLEPKFITELNEEDFIHRGSPDWNINTLDAAQAILKYNLAVTLLLQGEIDKAKTVIGACEHPVVATNSKMLKMYIELQAGNLENCRIMVRVDTPQYF